MPQASWIIPELTELKDKTSARDHVVLSPMNSGGVVRRPAGVEITDFATEPDESPELDIDTSAVIDGGIRRHTPIGKELHSNTGRQKMADASRVSVWSAELTSRKGLARK
jgi:hypothetical protein